MTRPPRGRTIVAIGALIGVVLVAASVAVLRAGDGDDPPRDTVESTDEPTALDAYGELLVQQMHEGDTLEVALGLFALAFGDVPGAVIPDAEIPTQGQSGTMALEAIRRHWTELSDEQQGAVRERLAVWGLAPEGGHHSAIAPSPPQGGSGRSLRMAARPVTREPSADEREILESLAAPAQRAYQQHGLFPPLEHAIQYAIVADTARLGKDGNAEATAEGTANPTTHKITIREGFFRTPVASQRYVISHEVFHVQWNDIDPSAGRADIEWLKEGGAAWAAATVSSTRPGDNLALDSAWSAALTSALFPLSDASYHAVYVFSELSNGGLDVWGGLRDAIRLSIRGGSNQELLRTVTGGQSEESVLLDMATARARRSWSSRWQSKGGPAMPAMSVLDRPVPLGAIDAPSATNPVGFRTAVVPRSDTGLAVLYLSGEAVAIWDDGSGETAISSAGTATTTIVCWRDCECPDGGSFPAGARLLERPDTAKDLVVAIGSSHEHLAVSRVSTTTLEEVCEHEPVDCAALTADELTAIVGTGDIDDQSLAPNACVWSFGGNSLTVTTAEVPSAEEQARKASEDFATAMRSNPGSEVAEEQGVRGPWAGGVGVSVSIPVSEFSIETYHLSVWTRSRSGSEDSDEGVWTTVLVQGVPGGGLTEQQVRAIAVEVATALTRGG